MGRSQRNKRQPTERDKQREQTRARVYQAAIDVFRRDGVQQARIDDITSEAGVSRGSFYFHFPDGKDDVLLQMLQESQSNICSEIEALKDEAPLGDVLGTIAENMAKQWQSDPSLLAELGAVAVRASAGGIGQSQQLQELHPLSVALAQRFEFSVSSGELSDLIPTELLAQMYLINLFGAAIAWCSNPELDLNMLLNSVSAFFMRAAKADS